MTDAVRREDSFSLTPYLILGFLVLLLALLARAPSSLLQKAVPAQGPVQVAAWGGTLWSGQAQVRLAGEPGFWRWRLQPLALLRGRIGLDLEGQGGLEVRGRLERGFGGWGVGGLSGQVSGSALQPLLPPGWSLPGDVMLDAVTLRRKGIRSGAWQVAEGHLGWPGGVMQYNLGSQPQSATLPELVMGLSLDGETLVLTLAEVGSGGVLADVRLAADGAVESRLRERLLRYSGRTGGPDPDAVVVTSVQPAPAAAGR
jgi:hypothetical protein